MDDSTKQVDVCSQSDVVNCRGRLSFSMFKEPCCPARALLQFIKRVASVQDWPHRATVG